MRVNQDFEINATAHSKRVVEVSTVYNNQFIHRLYIGYTLEQAKKMFMDKLAKGEIK